MSVVSPELSGPVFAAGVELSLVPEGGMLLGHALGEPVPLVRQDDDIFGIGAICRHYGAPLADGLLVSDTIRCPLICPLLSGPKSMLFWITKEIGNAIEEAQAGGDHWQVA